MVCEDELVLDLFEPKDRINTMRIDSFLAQGPGDALATLLMERFPRPLDCLALFSLGADHDKLVRAASRVDCPSIYLTETYGILGYDESVGRNIELMEKGRGQEYGYQGGSGGQGCLAVAWSDG